MNIIMRMARLLFVFLALGLLQSCATGPSHPSLQQSALPESIPLRDFFVNIDSNFGYQVSPDGEKVAWIAVKNRRLTPHFRYLDSDEVQIIDTHTDRSVMRFVWAQDSRRLLFLRDGLGDENHHVFSSDIQNPHAEPKELTPFPNTRVGLKKPRRSDPEHVLITHNQRDASVFDLYKLNINSGETTLLAQNDGNLLSWVVDEDGDLRGKIRRTDDEDRELLLKQPDGEAWLPLFRWPFDAVFQPMGFSRDKQSMWALSNRGRDLTGLVRVDLKTGEETLLYQANGADVGDVLISDLTRKPLVATSNPDYQQLHFFDDEAKAIAEQFLSQAHQGLYVTSADNRERKLVVAVYSDKAVHHYLFDRDSGDKQLLGQHPLSVYADRLATIKPVSFEASDGMRLHGYLTLPKRHSQKPLPMVLLVHGGPWARDSYALNPKVQFLANRGYAVLQVNYRGSRGYGRAYMEAAIGEFAGRMHQDLLDGVDWVVEQGVADPNKVCIMGGSYGGYATLVGLTFTPERFACGIDLVGPSNLISLTETVPAYWKHWMPFWYRYVGNPQNPGDREEMRARSPLFKVDAVTKPLLIAQGANDPRVKQQESDQMVEALRKAGKDVEYMLFADEGHGLTHWTNRLRYYRKVEQFLAQHLGGRDAGFDYYELGLLIY